MTVALVASMFAMSVVSTSAYAGTITFEIPDDQFKAANKAVYAHYWNNESGDGPAWQSKEEKMDWDGSADTATFEIPEGDWDLIIISGDSGWQTYDTVMTAACIGDTIFATGETMQNPVDSSKTAIISKWKDNSNLGPHKVISSLGEILGTSLIEGETEQDMYDVFVKNYGPGGVYDWSASGEFETGKTWEQIQAQVKKTLGLEDASSADESSSTADSNSSNAGSSSKASSNASSKAASSAASTGTTATGQSPVVFIVLGAVLVVAAGVILLTSRKKVSE